MTRMLIMWLIGFGLLSAPALADDIIKAAIITDAISQDQASDVPGGDVRPPRKPKTLGQILGIKRKPKTAAKLCGSKDIVGVEVAPIQRGACGIKQPVKVTEISGIKLVNGATINCATAIAVKDWFDGSVKKAFKRKGGGLVAVKVAASYSCRTRNNRKGAKLSEHAKGNAIDFSEFYLKKGQVLTVLKDWRGSNSKIMRKIHKDACGPFNTVLGPNADRYHQDHFHFDIARHRSGRYCR